MLRAAYSVPLAWLGPDTQFWLEHDDGSVTELPPPTSVAVRDFPPASESTAARTTVQSEPAGVESDRARELAARLTETRQRAERAEAANAQLTAALSELDIWRAELERSLTARTNELGAALAAREADERELARLRAALGEAESELALRSTVREPAGGQTGSSPE